MPAGFATVRPAGMALLAGLAAAWISAQEQPGVRPAGEVAAALQDRYDGIRDFTAEFVHTYEGGVLRRRVVERGTVQVKKPGMMRWAYTSPEEKLFVSDGVKIYSWVPADRQVIVSSMPDEDRATLAVLFLTGKGDLRRDFTVSYAEPPSPADEQLLLELVPREPTGDYERLILNVDRQSLQLRGLTARDQQGGSSSFEFLRMQENVGLTDKTFIFQMPRNVDVITDG